MRQVPGEDRQPSRCRAASADFRHYPCPLFAWYVACFDNEEEEPMRRNLLAYLAVAFGSLVSAPAVAADPALENGKVLFEKYCASCHGVDGRGGTELAKLFEIDPPDLTRIATRRGGWFPEVLIKEIVDGRFVAHGRREMPVWGETLTRDQITLVTEYLYGLQDNPTSLAP